MSQLPVKGHNLCCPGVDSVGTNNTKVPDMRAVLLSIMTAGVFRGQ